MNHPLTNEQVLQVRAEKSRRAMLRIAQADTDLAELEARAVTMPVAEFNRQKAAIEERRKMLRAEWEREKASWSR